jgi:hypothetical protein
MFRWELTRHASDTVGREPREKKERKEINEGKRSPNFQETNYTAASRVFYKRILRDPQ